MLLEQVYIFMIYCLFIELAIVTVVAIALFVTLVVTIRKLDSKKNTSLLDHQRSVLTFLKYTTNGTPHSVVSISYIFIIHYFIKMSIPQTWFFIRFESLHLNRQSYRCKPFYIFNKQQYPQYKFTVGLFYFILLYLLVVQQVLQV